MFCYDANKSNITEKSLDLNLFPNVHITTVFNHQQFSHSINFYFAQYDIVISLELSEARTLKLHNNGIDHFIIYYLYVISFVGNRERIQK